MRNFYITLINDSGPWINICADSYKLSCLFNTNKISHIYFYSDKKLIAGLSFNDIYDIVEFVKEDEIIIFKEGVFYEK